MFYFMPPSNACDESYMTVLGKGWAAAGTSFSVLLDSSNKITHATLISK
jgi:hypothetical protein